MEEGFGASKNEQAQSKKSAEEEAAAGDNVISTETERKSMIASELQAEETEQKTKTKRVATLDAFRGLTIVVGRVIHL